MVSAWLAVSTVAPLALRSVIVSVADAARSARICHDTDCVPPAATVATDWVELCGLSRRIESVGLKLTSTV